MHGMKRWILAILFLIICFLVNGMLTYLLRPYTYARVDVHNIQTNTYDDIIVGSSHGKCGINPGRIDQVTGRRSVNLCMGGEYPIDAYFLVKEACRNFTPKQVVYELDTSYFVTEPEQGVDYAIIYQEFPWSEVKAEYMASKMWKADFRASLFPWYAYVYRIREKSIKDIIEEKQSDNYKNYGVETFRSQAQSYEDTGFIRRFPIATDKISKDKLILWDETKLQEQSLEYFIKLIEFCQEKGIRMTVVTTPVPQVTIDENREAYQSANTYFEKLTEEYGVDYYDFNFIDGEGIDRNIDVFGDFEGHIYGNAADSFSTALGTYLK